MKKGVTALLGEDAILRLKHWAETNGRSLSGEARFAICKYIAELDHRRKKDD